VHFKLYLSNWTANRFEIHFVARSKVAITIPGLNLILSKCRMCRFLLSRSQCIVAYKQFFLQDNFKANKEWITGERHFSWLQLADYPCHLPTGSSTNTSNTFEVHIKHFISMMYTPHTCTTHTHTTHTHTHTHTPQTHTPTCASQYTPSGLLIHIMGLLGKGFKLAAVDK